MVFSDFNLPSTPNWRLRGVLAGLALAFAGLLLNVSRIMDAISSGGNFVALAILAPPAGFADQPGCDVPESKACFQSVTPDTRLHSASAAALVTSFGVTADTPTCSMAVTETCSGHATTFVPGAATLEAKVTFRYTVTVGYLTSGPPLTVGTRV